MIIKERKGLIFLIKTFKFDLLIAPFKNSSNFKGIMVSLKLFVGPYIFFLFFFSFFDKS